jgi:hypothetical protein
MRALNKKVITGVVAGTVVLGGSGVALAYWTTTGQGSAQATTTSANAKLIVQQKGMVSNLYPGAPAQAVVGTVTNDGPSSVFVRQVEVKISGVQSPGGPGCDAADYTITNPIVPVNAQLAKKGDLVEIHGATIAFNNKADENQDDCKGATVYLQFLAS